MLVVVTAILLPMGLTDDNFVMCRTALKQRLPVDGAAIRPPMAPHQLGGAAMGILLYRAGFGWRSRCGRQSGRRASLVLPRTPIAWSQ
jgi:hypothetical protein